MTLTKFISTAKSAGLVKYTLLSARNYELERGELAGLDADAVEAMCRADARPLAKGVAHEYVLVCESEDGVKKSRFPIPTIGGDDRTDEHRVDALQATSAGAVVGHLVRANVELTKQIVALATQSMRRDEEYIRELEKSRRKAMHAGEVDLVAKVIDAEAAERTANRERIAGLVNGAMQHVPRLVAAIAPAGKEAVLSAFRDSLTDDQLVRIGQAVGAVAFGRLMSLGPEKLAGFLVDRVASEKMAEVLAVLTDEQRGMIGPALQEHLEKRKAAASAEGAASS